MLCARHAVTVRPRRQRWLGSSARGTSLKDARGLVDPTVPSFKTREPSGLRKGVAGGEAALAAVHLFAPAATGSMVITEWSPPDSWISTLRRSR